MTEKQINLNIQDGDAFFSNEISINFNPTQFFLDFKSITPRIDARNQNGMTFALKHNTIIIEPYAAKQMADMLKEVLQKFEKEFGKIEKPKSIAKLEKKSKGEKTKGTVSPGYFG